MYGWAPHIPIESSLTDLFHTSIIAVLTVTR